MFISFQMSKYLYDCNLLSKRNNIPTALSTLGIKCLVVSLNFFGINKWPTSLFKHFWRLVVSVYNFNLLNRFLLCGKKALEVLLNSVHIKNFNFRRKVFKLTGSTNVTYTNAGVWISLSGWKTNVKPNIFYCNLMRKLSVRAATNTKFLKLLSR